MDACGVPVRIDVIPWLLAAALVGCGSTTTPGSVSPGTEVVAEVNGDQITVREFKEQLSRARLGPDFNAKVSEKQILQDLVDVQLLVQKAIADKLDEDPSTIRAIERARRQILAQAAIDDAGGEIAVSMQEARKFHADNPDLFEKRKIYTFRQFVLEATILDESLKDKLDHAKSPAEVMAFLGGAKVTYRYRTEVLAAEMLPLQILERAAKMRPGDILLLKDVGQIVLMQLVNAVLEPIDAVRALPAIRAHLAASRRWQMAENLLKDLRQNANVEYAGRFSGSPNGVGGKFATQPLSAAVVSASENTIRVDVRK